MTLLLMSLIVIGYAAPVRVGVEYCDHATPTYLVSKEQIEATPPEIRRKTLGNNKIWSILCQH